MKITLISPYPDIASLGIRIISSVLKQEGFITQLIFLPQITAEKSDETYFAYRYDQKVLEKLIEICDDSHLVGISLMTNYFEGAVQITKALKERLTIPVIWGGIHATIRPEECLNHADIVCVGEGEYALLELAHKLKEGESHYDIKNLWFKRDGHIIKNDLRPLIQDLDSLPLPDFDLESQYILEDNRILPLNELLLQRAMSRGSRSGHMKMLAYQTMATRGCPHKCTYCCNNTLKNLYRGQRYVRRRSTKNIIDELDQVKARFPFIQAFWFSDDSFFATTNDEIKQFSKLYQEKISLPFFCLGSPTTINEKKMAYLIEAGLYCIQMGIQSGSRRVCKEIYHRPVSNQQVLKAAQIINKHKRKMMPPIYDFILDNDYETREDILATLNLILKLPRPYQLQLFTLVLYPGTQLYNQAKEDGIIHDDKVQIYHKMNYQRRLTYLNLIFSFVKNNLLPKFILKLLIKNRVVKIFDYKLPDKMLVIVFDFGRLVKRCIH
jgi:radical SAM superfamily enzyme YgiQ (UPF0313 family)